MRIMMMMMIMIITAAIIVTTTTTTPTTTAPSSYMVSESHGRHPLVLTNHVNRTCVDVIMMCT